MTEQPRTSAIVIFLNEERFLQEAVESVRAQTDSDWELLLVDDGSSDGSTEIARRYARAEPGRIRYLEHAGHANRGMSAARNAGLAAARGDFVAFLDADDIWLPQRIERGAALLDTHPEADMLYGRSQYWLSWAGGAVAARDWIQPHGFRADCLIAPPELLRMFLAGEAFLPCPGSMMLRRLAALSSGGFVEQFRGLYEDQAFLARFCLDHAVYVSNETWDRYRQHPDSACAVAARSEAADRARDAYHAWLAQFLESRQLRGTPLWDAAVRAQASAGRGWKTRIGRALRAAIRRALPDRSADTRTGEQP